MSFGVKRYTRADHVSVSDVIGKRDSTATNGQRNDYIERPHTVTVPPSNRSTPGDIVYEDEAVYAETDVDAGAGTYEGLRPRAAAAAAAGEPQHYQRLVKRNPAKGAGELPQPPREAARK